MLLARNAMVIFEDDTPRDTLLHGVMEEGCSDEIIGALIPKFMENEEFRPAVYNAMVMAADKQRTDLVKIFLQKNVSVNAMNHQDKTALMKAAYNNDCHTTKSLLQNNADPNLLDSNGKTALFYVLCDNCNNHDN